MPSRFEESLQRDIERIRAKLTAMAALGERAVWDCMKALQERNRQLAYSVIIRDQRIDELEKEIDRLCLEFIVRQQPVAGPLRFAYSTIKINSELERVGDYAESMARQTLKLLDMDVPVPLERFMAIANLSLPMLRDAIQAFVKQDAELARKTIEIEDAVDGLKSKLNKDLVSLFKEGKLPFEALNPGMQIARRLERVSDQARNICMETLYVCTGEHAKHPGAEVYRVLFVDEHNSCRSQMAEAIAASLNQPKFIFTSAGLDPRPIDSFSANFLKEKGLDVSRHAPKAVNQVPNLDHYHVIVALAKEARRAFPPSPRNVVILDWAVADPSAVKGTPAEVRVAYEQTYQFLHEHIKDLVEAVLKDDPN
jgi:phosphate transport system protein